MIRYCISICFILWTLTNVQAQSIQVNAQFEQSAITVGDQVMLRIELERQKNIHVQFPVWADTLTRHIEIIEVHAVDSMQTTNEMVRLTQDIIVTSFDSGRHVVLPIRFPFTADSLTDTIATRPIYLNVLTTPIDSMQHIADIKPIYTVPVDWSDIWPWLLGFGLVLLLVAVIGFIIYAIIRKRKNMPIFGEPKPMEPPHTIALRELDKLRSEKLWQSRRTKEYYTRLSDILRTYIEARFAVAAMEMTKEEILTGLQSTGFEDNNLVNRLRSLLTLADLVKFAKAEPLPDENETSILDGYLFVNNTKIEVISEQMADDSEGQGMIADNAGKDVKTDDENGKLSIENQ